MFIDIMRQRGGSCRQYSRYLETLWNSVGADRGSVRYLEILWSSVRQLEAVGGIYRHYGAA